MSAEAPTPTRRATRLVLLRHGRTSWNAAGRVQGQLESELDDTGHGQASDAAVALAHLAPVALWSSDSVRALCPDFASYREHHSQDRLDRILAKLLEQV